MKKSILFTLMILVIAFNAYSQKTNVIWSEDFEGDWTVNWFAESGTWSAGIPTNPNGPDSAFRGTSCASNGLNNNYPGGTTSRFIRIQSFMVPDANQNPEIRFWQWYNFGSDIWGPDYGNFQIKEVGSSTWNTISPNYTGTCGDVWTYPVISLKAYAGKNVQIAFLYGSGGGGPGWFIDDVSLISGPNNFTFPEGFENGMGEWFAETGVWEIGEPASGPNSAHSGHNCAATILAGNYPGGASSRLVSPAFLVPAMNLNPRIRFWQWYNLGSNIWGPDVATVQIKEVDSSLWTTISPNYTGTCGDVWTYPSISLANFSGKNVQIAFSLQSGGGGIGWYVDDISLITGPFAFSSLETFESGMGDWYAETGLWEIGAPTSGPNSAHSGQNCGGTILSGNYPGGSSSRLISPPFHVPDSTQNPSVRFWHWYDLGSNIWGPDVASVQIKAVDSSTWATISPNYTGTGGNIWTYPFISLNSFAGQYVQIAFSLQSGGGGIGWYVDDIKVLIDSVNISGGVTDPGGTPVNTGTVILFNTNTQYGGFDTTDIVTIVNGNFVSRIPASYPSIVLAMPDPSQMSNMLPTYYGDVLYWMDADTVMVSSNTNIGSVHFISPPTALTGSATISGHVLGNLVAKANDPIDNVGVIIKKTTGSTTSGYTRTGSDGSFSFLNVETGDYTILVDYTGIPMYQVGGDNIVSITNPSESVEVTAHVDSGYIWFKSTGISQNDFVNSHIRIFPNPTSGKFNLYISDCNCQIIAVEIADIRGRVVFAGDIKNNDRVNFCGNLDLSGLEVGLYVVRIRNKESSQNVTLIIK
jgi:hypothetical protein